jgi:hypothetical protein
MAAPYGARRVFFVFALAMSIATVVQAVDLGRKSGARSLRFVPAGKIGV